MFTILNRGRLFGLCTVLALHVMLTMLSADIPANKLRWAYTNNKLKLHNESDLYQITSTYETKRWRFPSSFILSPSYKFGLGKILSISLRWTELGSWTMWTVKVCRDHNGPMGILKRGVSTLSFIILNFFWLGHLKVRHIETISVESRGKVAKNRCVPL